MKSKSIFERYELKYFVSQKQKKELLELFKSHMLPDEFGQSNINNLYYDTNDFLLIRRSIDKPIYKEKLRLRSYGKTQADTDVFLELKKKYDDVVYKRRITLKESDATDYFKDRYKLSPSQIADEIDYFRDFYKLLKPKAFIGYDRTAFFGKEDDNLRVTFDENIVWRDSDLSLLSGNYGNIILPPDTVLMEIKVSLGIPLWLSHYLTKNKIYKTTFSKYGFAYNQIVKKRKDKNHAA